MQQSITTSQLETLPTSKSEGLVRALSPSPGSLLSWLTVERAFYVGLALLALVLRLVGLGVHPLSDAEAGQALVAWHVYQGQPVEQTGYSPLIVTLNLVSFALLGGSEFAARLGPALLGVALVLLPYGLRSHLGRKGALFASALLAISPTTVYLSRTVNGDIGVAVGGLALTIGLFNWLHSLHGDPIPNSQSPNSKLESPISHLYLAVAGLVVTLTASPAAYSMLVLLVGFLALAMVVGDKSYASSARQGLAALRDRLGNLGLILLLGLLSVATTFLFNMRGLGAIADLLTTWLLGFASARAQPGVYPAVFLLTLYEPLILLAGLFGLSVSLLRRRLLDLFLGWWFFGSVALNLLRSGRANSDVLIPLVPLTLLAGLALGMLWDSLRQEGSWQKEGILVITGLIIGGYAYVSLMTYTRSGGLTFWLPVAGLGLFATLVVLFAVWYDGISALRAAALVGLIVLAIFTFATGSRLNNTFPGVGGGGRSVADPRQPLVGAPAGEGLLDLATTLKQISGWQTGDPYLLEVVADRRLGPAVEWSLRDFKNVTWVDSLDSWPPATPLEGSDTFPAENPVLLIPADVSLSSEEGYAGQDFAVRAVWSPAGLSRQSLIRWILLRTAPTPVNFERAVLWVEVPQVRENEEQGRTSGESIR